MMEGSFPLTEPRTKKPNIKNIKLENNEATGLKKNRGRPLSAEWWQQMGATGLRDPKLMALSKYSDGQKKVLGERKFEPFIRY